MALRAHPTWRQGPLGFADDWRQPSDIDAWRRRWATVEDYLERVIPAAASTRHARTEGAVQAAVSAFADSSRVMLDREVAPHFLDKSARASVLGPLSAQLVSALRKDQALKGKVPSGFGAECDLLASDNGGRLLAVEVKPSVTSLAWAPAQATMYANVLQAWTHDDSADTPGWRNVIRGMLEQRQELGLASRGFRADLPDQPLVVPVVAFQRGASTATAGSALAGAAGIALRRSRRSGP